MIYTPFSPAENYAMSRGEAVSAARAQVADYWDQRASEEMNFVHLLQTRLGAEVRDFSPILDALRSIKSPREIDLIRRASQIAAFGIIEAMKATEPGVYEYHLDAAARYMFLVHGARLDGLDGLRLEGDLPAAWRRPRQLDADERRRAVVRDDDRVLDDAAAGAAGIEATVRGVERQRVRTGDLHGELRFRGLALAGGAHTDRVGACWGVDRRLGTDHR